MSKRFNVPLRIAAVTGAVTMTAMAMAPAAMAAEGDVKVANTETVQVYTDATGAVKTRRVYEQVAMTGTGTVDLSNPIETDGLRNLDGFGGFEVENGNQVTTVSVDGEERLRTVSDYDGELPLEVEVQYFLDGERVEPGDVVGADGELEVKYTVRNVTATQQEVTFSDGAGGEVTKTVNVPIPMVGSLTTTAPSNFTDVESGQANIAGDGKGGTKLSFTMTLFPPLGSDTAEFGYTANISDGVIPRADISALPVNPLASPTFKTAADSYQGGSETGATLADGATQIDTNLLKLRDGAGDLLAGLIQLRDGSSELEAGLSGEAAPGAQELADGAGQLDDGLGQINSGARRLAAGTGELLAGTGDLADGTGRLRDGAGRLADGAGRLSAGTGDAFDGSKKLTSGLKLISGGLDTLSGTSGLPAAQAGIKQLQGGMTQIVAGFGDASSPTSLIGGLTALETGLGTAQTGSAQLAGGLVQLRGDGSPATPGLVGAKGGVDQVKAGLDNALSTAPADIASPNPDLASLAKLAGGLQQVKANFCPTQPAQALVDACNNTLDQLIAGVGRSRTNLTDARDGLGLVSTGLGNAITGLNTQLIPGANQLAAGITTAKDGSTKLKGGAIQLKGGAQQVSDGLNQLSTGVTSAVSGVLQLADGADSAVTGSSDLSDGLGQINAGAGELAEGAGQLADGTGELDAGANRLRDGAGQLNDGAGQLADGTGDASDGSGRLADGAGRLADGLQDAANGSTRLTDGLEQAAEGAPKLVDGAQRLSDEGTSQLVEAGEDTAQNFGELYATMEAGSERAQTENMAYGAPEGAEGMTAYSFVIEGENGEGGRNMARGLAGIAVLGAGAGAFALRRRLV